MKTFLEFLDIMEGGQRTGAKTGLYPLGYAGIGNYPTAYMMNNSADALTYMSHDERLNAHLGGSPFDITRLGGTSVPPKESKMPGKIVPPKESPLPKNKEYPRAVGYPGHGMPGKEVRPKGKRMKCLVAEPDALPPQKVAQNGAEDSICSHLWQIPETMSP